MNGMGQFRRSRLDKRWSSVYHDSHRGSNVFHPEADTATRKPEAVARVMWPAIEES